MKVLGLLLVLSVSCTTLPSTVVSDGGRFTLEEGQCYVFANGGVPVLIKILAKITNENYIGNLVQAVGMAQNTLLTLPQAIRSEFTQDVECSTFNSTLQYIQEHQKGIKGRPGSGKLSDT